MQTTAEIVSLFHFHFVGAFAEYMKFPKGALNYKASFDRGFEFDCVTSFHTYMCAVEHFIRTAMK